MADTNMVPRVNPNVCQEPTPPFSEKKSSERSRRIESPPYSEKLPKINGLDHLRESLHAEGIS